MRDKSEISFYMYAELSNKKASGDIFTKSL